MRALPLLLLLLAPPAHARPCGDCTGDGVITVLDALAAARAHVGLELLVAPAHLACDVDASGLVTVLDALQIAAVAAGLPGHSLLCPTVHLSLGEGSGQPGETDRPLPLALETGGSSMDSLEVHIGLDPAWLTPHPPVVVPGALLLAAGGTATALASSPPDEIHAVISAPVPLPAGELATLRLAVSSPPPTLPPHVVLLPLLTLEARNQGAPVSITPGAPGIFRVGTARQLTDLRATDALGSSVTYDEVVSIAAGGHPLVLVAPGESQQLILEGSFDLPPLTVDLAAASNPEGTTSYTVVGGGVSVSADGLVTAGSDNGCALVEATFTPGGLSVVGPPTTARFVACVNRGGPDDDPPGDRTSLAPGEVDLTLPGLPDGPVVPAAGGSMDLFVEIQAGALHLGGYQLLLRWSPAAPHLVLDPSFGGAGGGAAGDFGVSHDDPVTGLPLSAMDLGPIVLSDNAVGETRILDAVSGLTPGSTGVVRVAVLRFLTLAGAATTASLSGTVEAVASTDPVPDPTIGAPTPRPLWAGAGSFRLP